MKVNHKKDIIAEIANSARKEEELENQILDIQKTWETIEFNIEYNRDRGYHIFVDIEEI